MKLITVLAAALILSASSLWAADCGKKTCGCEKPDVKCTCEKCACKKDQAKCCCKDCKKPCTCKCGGCPNNKK